MDSIRWIAVEAGRAQARAFAIGDLGQVVATWQGPVTALPDHLTAWRGRDRPVFCAGLVTPPPRPLPGPPLPATSPPPDAGGLRHLPGLHQPRRPVTATPAMAARVAGVLAAQPDWDGVICLSGAQTLWAHVSAGEVISLCLTSGQTLFAALHGSGAPATDDSFDDTLSECLSRPERLVQVLALPDAAPGSSVAAQAGTVIGAELAAARHWWLGQPVRVLGRDGWPALYTRALTLQGVAAIPGDGDAALIAGLGRLARP